MVIIRYFTDGYCIIYPAGIEPTTFRIQAENLNHWATGPFKISRDKTLYLNMTVIDNPPPHEYIRLAPLRVSVWSQALIMEVTAIEFVVDDYYYINRMGVYEFYMRAQLCNCKPDDNRTLELNRWLPKILHIHPLAGHRFIFTVGFDEPPPPYGHSFSEGQVFSRYFPPPHESILNIITKCIG